MKHLQKNDLNELRALLEGERDTLEEELKNHGHAVPETEDWQATSSGLEGEESDPTDAADQIEELITNVPVVENLEARHKEIVSALSKMTEGRYGICEVCGESIPLERLRANPAARTCIAHSS